MACCRPCYNGPCGFITLVIWWIPAGLIMGCLWFLIGCICCCVPGIGKTLRRLGCMAFDPLSKKMEIQLCDTECVGCCLCENLCNIIWLLPTGICLFSAHLFLAICCLPCMLCCIQLSSIHWKFAKAALWPVGVKLFEKNLKPQQQSMV